MEIKMSIRDFACNELSIFGKHDKVENCEGVDTSTQNGQDSICCAKCMHVRILFYRNKIALYKGHLFDLVNAYIQKYDFINLLIGSCKTQYFCYQITPFTGDIMALKDRLKDHFRFRNELKIKDRVIKRSQVYNQIYCVPIVFPSLETEFFTVNSDEDCGVKITISSERKEIEFIDTDKVYMTGKYVYILNYYQTIELLSYNVSSSSSLETFKGKVVEYF